MILQSVIFPNPICPQKEIYYSCTEELLFDNDKLKIPPLSHVSFFSYMNLFDSEAWGKYTMLSNVKFILSLCGTGRFLLKCRMAQQERILADLQFASDDFREYSVTFDLNEHSGICYFEILSDSGVLLNHARFEAAESEAVLNDIKLALNICTYKRADDINRNMKQIMQSRFFKPDDTLYKKLYLMIVDNASQLNRICESNRKLVYNSNTGGSGGFKKGLKHIRKSFPDSSHVIFMDDDVEFLMESFYRLFAFLSYIRPGYQEEALAGRMFRLDQKWIQYTAAEIWNRGILKHIGFLADMTDESNLSSVNDNSGAEYGGWWFCCYPMAFAKKNNPLPFFLHCDDVEYGLRHGGTPIILNGIQVWHETYEYRQSPLMAYYDTRNALIVNSLYSLLPQKEVLMLEWKNRIYSLHEHGDFLTERMVILGIIDFLKGNRWFKWHNPAKNHRRILRECNDSDLQNEVLWKKIISLYKKNRN